MDDGHRHFGKLMLKGEVVPNPSEKHYFTCNIHSSSDIHPMASRVENDGNVVVFDIFLYSANKIKCAL